VAALDSHTHLDIMGRPVTEVMAEALAAGIVRAVTVGCDLPSSRWAAGCAAEHDAVYAAVAIHPNEVAAAAREPGAASPHPGAAPHPGASPQPRADAQPGAAPQPGAEDVLAEIEALARQPRVVAVGETGLDYYRDHSAPDLQRWWFREHIKIAKRIGKALMIHDREAHADVLAILEQEGPPERVVFHCFSGDAAMARQCAEAGYVMSFAGNVTFPSAQPLREAAAVAPADLILAETDAPFLTPVPNRGRPNSPAMVAYTLRFLAEVKGMDVADLCHAVTATAERTFGPW
jgi:TatD DNase family protein